MRSLLIPVLILLLVSCGERAEPEQAQRAAASSPASTPAASTAPAAGSIVVRSADGAEAVSIRENDAEVVEISFTEAGQKRALRGEPRSDGKRKYSIGGGAVTYEVKPDNDSDGFKLRTADGKLRWKVKVAPEKIKISDNEQNERPFELKVRDGDRVKVVAPVDREVGNVRFDRAASKTEVENAAGTTVYRVEGPTPSGAYGVLLLDINQTERAILLAEILSRGR
ncbi:MAG: hypothetical protein M3P06_23960 [Acidobacteriota bacterium]|nr:hypothetical protein [Acidobacteriota bacterium]